MDTIRMQKNHITLTGEERTYLQKLIRQGELPNRLMTRATALLALDKGQTMTAVAATLGVTISTLSTLANKYRTEKLLCLKDKARSGRPPQISGEQRAKITALACSTPPEGHSRWTLRLLAEQAVQLAYVEEISHTAVSTILKKRPQASSETTMVYWQADQSVFSEDGSCSLALSSAL